MERLDGIKEITNGFRGFRETNTVFYDANIIEPQEMISALQEAGTYIGVAEK